MQKVFCRLEIVTVRVDTLTTGEIDSTGMDILRAFYYQGRIIDINPTFDPDLPAMAQTIKVCIASLQDTIS
ncbi:MAG TPA: hypothetical protein PLL26_06410 [Candidatus Dojkabacteria bacterium]|nr:hypothetical protein [Candidatus Dojkabacteria bacterium]